MAQKIINVGSVANDGTGDTIRGAFTNVNANFTEVYTSVIQTGVAFSVANAAFDEANVIYTSVGSLAVGANAWANAVGTAGNAYAVSVGSSSNAFATSVSSSVGAAANSYSVSIGDAANSYASILSSNNAVGGNAWANAVGTASNNWSLSTFTTLSNTSIVFNTANAAFSRSNTAFQNTSGTFSGNLSISGTCTSLGGFSDAIGSVREKFANTTNSDLAVVIGRSVIIANNSGQIYISIENDNNFLLPANVGSSIEIYQYGPGQTTVQPISPAVTIKSANNWANIAGQYLTVSLVKILPNTWILTGNLKA